MLIIEALIIVFPFSLPLTKIGVIQPEIAHIHWTVYREHGH